MAVTPASKHLPCAWECGLKCEIGLITFSMLAPFDRKHPDTATRIHATLVSACRNIPKFTTPFIEELHRMATRMCSVVKARDIFMRGKKYELLNCLVRVKSFIPANQDQKQEYLQLLSKSLFRTYNKVKHQASAFLKKHKLIFNDNHGLLLTNVSALKLAVKTLSFDITNVNLPRCLPRYAGGCSKVVGCTSTFSVEKAETGAAVNQNVFLRSMLKTVVPEDVHNLVLPGICYNPGAKYYTSEREELWCVHLHTEYNKYSNVDSSKFNPISLQDAARLKVLETAFKIRRARTTNNRKSPYFKFPF